MERKVFFLTRINDIIFFLNKKNIIQKTKPFLDSIEKNLENATTLWNLFFKRAMEINKMPYDEKRIKEAERLEKEVATPLLGLIQKMKKDIISIKKLI